MLPLSERDIQEIATIERKAARYKELCATLLSHINQGTDMPVEDYAELKRVAMSIATDVERLLGYITRLRGEED